MQSEYPVATSWAVRGSNPAGGDEIFLARPDRPWRPPSLLCDGFRLSLPVVKWPGRGVDHPPPHLAPRLQKENSAYGRSWPVLGELYLFTGTDTPNSSVDFSTSTMTVVKEKAISLPPPPGAVAQRGPWAPHS